MNSFREYPHNIECGGNAKIQVTYDTKTNEFVVQNTVGLILGHCQGASPKALKMLLLKIRTKLTHQQLSELNKGLFLLSEAVETLRKINENSRNKKAIVSLSLNPCADSYICID